VHKIVHIVLEMFLRRVSTMLAHSNSKYQLSGAMQKI